MTRKNEIILKFIAIIVFYVANVGTNFLLDTFDFLPELPFLLVIDIAQIALAWWIFSRHKAYAIFRASYTAVIIAFSWVQLFTEFQINAYELPEWLMIPHFLLNVGIFMLDFHFLTKS